MTQNDMSIANGAGGTVRSDVNSALQALASNNAGASAPGTTYATMWWFDTVNDILFIRDEANSNWVEVASLVGTTWVLYSGGAVLGTMANLAYAAVAQNLTMDADKHVAFDATAVSSSTPNFAAAGNVAVISGTGTANTLGTVQEGFIGFIVYTTAITLTHNATTRDLPTSTNITTAAGDVEIVMSKGSGNWRTVAYMRKDGSSLGGAIASQSQMEAASATTVSVSPGRFQYHPGAIKFWADLDTTGTYNVNVSHNLTSATDGGSGRPTLTIATDFSSADWAFSCGYNHYISVPNSGAGNMLLRDTDGSARAAGSIEFTTGASSSNIIADFDVVDCMGVGDQA